MFKERHYRELYQAEDANVRRLSEVNKEQAMRIAAQQTTIDWLMVRVTQVEKERAQLFERYTGVKIVIPEIVKTPVEHKPRDHSFDQPVSFEDMGDIRASALGLGWNEDGTLKA